MHNVICPSNDGKYMMMLGPIAQIENLFSRNISISSARNDEDLHWCCWK